MTSIYSRKDTPKFDELWSLCILEETRLKAKYPNEKFQDFVARVKKKGKFGKFEPCQKYHNNNQSQSKVQCFRCNEHGHFKRDCPKDPQNRKNNKRKERSGAHIVEENEELEKKLKSEDPKDLYY